ncbi:amidohydrolase family protein [Sulfuracidifex metallicus]|uniref:amidohydrolase family protein n=1 Tax=Sulfuracidifex metallicus TaxID=47303 RepID=UPI002275005C|nr:amidohydrolase family protein [Sulfuracidifex metallicus]MCY0849869.1 amidohydrolase family protein [Sulfuracidifex metallicus]
MISTQLLVIVMVMVIKGLSGMKELRVDGRGTFNAEGRLALPAFYDMHLHPENAFTLGLTGENSSSTLKEAVTKWSKVRDSMSVEEIKDRMKKALLLELYHGVTHVRIHVDMCSKDIRSVKAAVLLKEEMKEIMDIQTVAFPEQSLFKCGNDLLYASQFTDLVGGKPDAEDDVEMSIKHLSLVTSVAKKLEKSMDIHIDQDARRTRFAEYLLSIAENHVTLSHMSSLHYEDDDYVKKIYQMIRNKKASVVSSPLTAVYLAAEKGYPKGRGITRIREMMKEEINVCLGNDDLQNVFYPFGAGDILLSMFMAINLEQSFTADDWIPLVTSNAEKEFSLINVPSKDFVILDASSFREQMSTMAPRFMVIRNGKILAKTNRESRLIVNGSSLNPYLLMKSLTD